MQDRQHSAASWLLAAVVIGGSFLAGSGLRSWQNARIPHEDLSAQTYALLKLTPECAPVSSDELKDTAKSDNRELINSVFKLLKIHYVEPIDAERETEMARGAVRNMLDSLSDPDSRFLDPKERKLLDDAGSGNFHGVGAVFAVKNTNVSGFKTSSLVVVTPVPGGPADKAGIRPGDTVTHIDGKWIISHDPFKEPEMEKLLKSARNKEIDEYTYQKAYEAALKRLKDGVTIASALDTLVSKDSGEVELQFERSGKGRKAKVECRKTTIRPVESKNLGNGIYCIRVFQFNSEAGKQLAAEMDKARKAGGKGIILDLRNNPGGLLDSATSTVAKVTGGGKIATIKEKGGQRVIKLPKTRAFGLPMVVLVNAGTASVSELAAGALRESGAATLVGERTFGDSLIQTPLLLKDGSAAVITTGKMLTSKGADFEGKGIQPDVRISQNKPDVDNQLQEAQRILLAKIRKSGGRK